MQTHAEKRDSLLCWDQLRRDTVLNACLGADSREGREGSIMFLLNTVCKVVHITLSPFLCPAIHHFSAFALDQITEWSPMINSLWWQASRTGVSGSAAVQ